MKRRLLSLIGMAPLREAVKPSRRPMPGRGRGRPALKRWSYDYSDMYDQMANADRVIANTDRVLERLNIKDG